MSDQIGWRGLRERLKAEAPRCGQLRPQLPRLAHHALSIAGQPQQNAELMTSLLGEQKRTNRLLGTAIYFGSGLLIGVNMTQLLVRFY